jgi:hypothetical protein
MPSHLPHAAGGERTAATAGHPEVLSAGAEPRRAAFGYACHRCRTCCAGKDIRVNPYEIARLARRLGETTGEFRARHTRDGAGAVLRQTETGACVFLGPGGCTVHPDRPLVCRLYPLGRHVLDDGSEWFSRMELDAGSAGEFTDRGTIADFLDQQGAGPFLAAADDYFAWFCAARALIEETAAQPGGQGAAPAMDLTDMDAAIAGHCARHGLPEPSDIEARKYMHLTILHRQLDVLHKENHHGP